MDDFAVAQWLSAPGVLPCADVCCSDEKIRAELYARVQWI